MELSLRTSSSSYVVCDATARGWESGISRQVALTIIPRDSEMSGIILDFSTGDTLDLIAALTSELRKDKERL